MFVYIYIYTHTHIYIYTHTHTHTYIYIQSSWIGRPYNNVSSYQFGLEIQNELEKNLNIFM